MARSNISNTTKSVNSDDGAVLFSVINGEQIHYEITVDWITNLTGYNIHANIVECANDGSGTKPTEIKSGGVQVLLTQTSGHIREVDDGNNKFKLVIPYNVANNMVPQPKPDRPIYAYFDLEIGEPGTGDTSPIGDAAAPEKQVWKPIRGLIEIRYSTTEPFIPT